MVKQYLSAEPVVKIKANPLKVVRVLPLQQPLLLPPLTRFNTGYLKEKKHDPL